MTFSWVLRNSWVLLDEEHMGGKEGWLPTVKESLLLLPLQLQQEANAPAIRRDRLLEDWEH